MSKQTRFWLFGYDNFYPSGGIEDLLSRHPSRHEAVNAAFENDRSDQYQIVDAETAKCIETLSGTDVRLMKQILKFEAELKAEFEGKIDPEHPQYSEWSVSYVISTPTPWSIRCGGMLVHEIASIDRISKAHAIQTITAKLRKEGLLKEDP